MEKLHKKLMVFFILAFFLPKKTEAVCAMCTVATCAGIGLSRWIGIDDLITGLWIGGFLASIVVIIANYLDKKEIIFKSRDQLIVFGSYSMVIGGLYGTKLIGSPTNTFCCIDKLLLGIAIGSIVLILSNASYNITKKRNNNKVYFPYQRVVIPISVLLIASIIFSFILKC